MKLIVQEPPILMCLDENSSAPGCRKKNGSPVTAFPNF